MLIGRRRRGGETLLLRFLPALQKLVVLSAVFYSHRWRCKMKQTVVVMAAFLVLTITSNAGICAELSLVLGPEELVEANSVDIAVPGYSVPSYVDWNNDGLKDLIIGGNDGKVRVYLNVGTESNPQFSAYFHAQSNGADLVRTGPGCMGCFPRVVYWDGDARKDLLIGRVEGYVEIFLNIGTDESPTFDGGTLLQEGPLGSKTNINVAGRATSCIVDWNNDDKKDMAIGALDGRIHLFINEGTDTEPDFLVETFAQEDGSDLYVPSNRSSPHVCDLDNDDKKDLLTGNTNGQLIFYRNVGTDAAPTFSGYVLVESDGVPIDLPGTPRSRPFVCDWTGDNYLDVLIGALDGNVHLYQGLPFLGDFEPDGDVDFFDFAVLGSAWRSTPNDDNWNSACDISDPKDGVIDELDLAIFTENWLASIK